MRYKMKPERIQMGGAPPPGQGTFSPPGPYRTSSFAKAIRRYRVKLARRGEVARLERLTLSLLYTPEPPPSSGQEDQLDDAELEALVRMLVRSAGAPILRED